MAKKKKKRRPQKTFRFQLSLGGVAGIGVVCFCLFLWMFLLGIWAGQTILLPAARPGISGTADGARSGPRDREPVQTLVSGAKKKPSPTPPQR